MLYSEVIDYLYQHLPIFQQQGASALKVGLNGIQKLCDFLGNPEKKIKTIHIGGTNGKGSTSHMLASVLQESGYKTGLYTSPHLVDFRERIKTNGQFITEKYVIDFVEKNKPFFDQNSFSFFEVTVALAFKYFVDNQVDIAVIEVGLGGRLDSTNIINPILALITNISDDHKQILGETLPEIAKEKAGIIKKKTPIVISTTQIGLDELFLKKAKDMEAEIYFADQNFRIKSAEIKDNYQVINYNENENNLLKTIELDLLGSYQQANILGVLQVIKILNKLKITLSPNAISNGLKNTIKNTGLLGRWQKIQEAPLVICDTGHNYAGVSEVLKNINQQKYDTLHLVIGFVKDKEIEKILTLLPQKAEYYFCNANIPRALEAEILAENALNFGLKGKWFNTVEEAFLAAKNKAKTTDFIFIGGSTFVVADYLVYLDNSKIKWDEKN